MVVIFGLSLKNDPHIIEAFKNRIHKIENGYSSPLKVLIIDDANELYFSEAYKNFVNYYSYNYNKDVQNSIKFHIISSNQYKHINEIFDYIYFDYIYSNFC